MKELTEIISKHVNQNNLKSLNKIQLENDILNLFKDFKCYTVTFDNENCKNLQEDFWAKNKDDLVEKIYHKYPNAKWVNF